VVRAALAFGLAGLAAAGVAMSAARAPNAAPIQDARTARQPCTPGKSDGQAVQDKYKLTVGGKAVYRKALKKGDWVATDRRGAAEVCLKLGDWKCKVSRRTRLRVLPPTSKALIRLASGQVNCSTRSGDRQAVETPGALLMLGDPPVSGVRAATAAASNTGSVISLTAGAKQTVVKIGRGVGILAGSANPDKAVVLGRLEQSRVPKGGDPAQPTAAQLTPAQQTIFAQLERSLPAQTDKTPPLAAVNGPHALSSVRRARFVLNATEQAIFSCSLDGSEFRLCTDVRQRYDRLPPGKHTFAMKATDQAGNTSSPAQYAWTIDSSRVAFASVRDGNPEIYVADPDGENAVRLTNNLVSDENPDWSPDRDRLTFDSLRKDNLDVYVMNADGSAQTPLTSSPAVDRNPTWSPDGRKIAFESFRDGNREIYVMNADGSAQTRLTNDPALDFDPTWSPDSRKLAFTSTRDDNYEIYSMNVDGRAQTRLTNHPAVEFGPTWSPDGKRIAFHSLRSDQYHNIYMMNPDGTDVTRLTNTEQADQNPSWAPDSFHLVYQSNRDADSEVQLYVLDIATREEFRLTPLGRANYVPDW